MMPMDWIQDGAVTLVMIVAAALVLRRQLWSSRKDATPKCSNCASGCEDPAETTPAKDATSHPLILVRRPRP